jgi:NADH-quinone oxidoreductase subunit J
MNSLLLTGGILIPVILGGLAIWMLLPRPEKRVWVIGGLCGLSALLAVLGRLAPPTGEWLPDGMFYLFAATAVLSAAMMITDRKPVHAALWFAMATLGTCGLFLLNSAPFLAAATIIVYAGAIVVMFVFVIMLAQPAGVAGYDRQAYQPVLATMGGFLLLGALLFTLQQWGGVERRPNVAAVATVQFVKPPHDVRANLLSQPQNDDLGSLRSIGRSLFGDYLFTVELAGSALLIATIGAIAIAPRRAQGTL